MHKSSKSKLTIQHLRECFDFLFHFYKMIFIFDILYLLDLDSKMIATEKTVEDLTQRLQWLYESLEKSKNELKEKEAEVKLILQEREKLLIR